MLRSGSPCAKIGGPVHLKGFLFLATGLLSAGLLLFYNPSIKVAVLLVISIWCFARFYYFAFYVTQNYVDEDYRFAGLSSFSAYAIRQNFGGGRPLVDGRPPKQDDRN